MIFVNLPVVDLDRSKAFYEAIGFTVEPKFTNDQAACMVWSDTIFVMLLRHEFWRTFTTRAIVDAKASAQVLLCVNLETRDAVDDVVADAERAGGTIDPCPVQDMGFMYGRSFTDPDGHIWEPMWMSQEAVDAGPMEMPGA